MTFQQRSSASRSHLRRPIPNNWSLIQGPEDNVNHNQPPSRLTLHQAWERWRLPRLIEEGRRHATIADYKTALNAWSRWCKSRRPPEPPKVDRPESPAGNRVENPVLATPRKHGIFPIRPSVSETEGPEFGSELSTEPSVDQINQAVLAEFRVWLVQEQPRSKLTINRAMRNIRSILLAAESAGAIDGAPTLRRLPAAKNRAKVYIQSDHVEAIYRACKVATWPIQDEQRRPLPHDPATYWRAAIVMWWCYGFRTQELIAYEHDHEPLTWSQISYELTSPISEVQSEQGWLWYVPQKQEALKPEPLVLPLCQAARRALQSIRPRQFDATLPVFPFPLWKKEFYGTWAAIVRAANVRPRWIGGEQVYQIKHLRKSCATYHNLHNRGIAPFILGHASRDNEAVAMTDGHYDNVELALVRHFASVPVPSAFSSPSSGQLELFAY
jgi:integrase